MLGFDGVADALEDAERALGRSAVGGPVSSTELAEVSRALDLLPSIAWGAKPPRSGVELPEDVGLLASGWPLCILVFGPPALETSLSAADEEGIEVEHACEKACACTTCHVIVREGFDSLSPSSDDEDDLLDRAWGLTSVSRLSCQAKVADTDLVVEIPKYTINYAKER